MSAGRHETTRERRDLRVDAASESQRVTRQGSGDVGVVANEGLEQSSTEGDDRAREPSTRAAPGESRPVWIVREPAEGEAQESIGRVGGLRTERAQRTRLGEQNPEVEVNGDNF